jgi:uncharacterized membrane protein YhhN
MTKKNTPFLLLLFLITLADIYFTLTGEGNRLYTKPLLMPLLMLVYFRGQDNNTSFSGLIYAALICAWLGDIFLLFEQHDGFYFILGLSSFLTAHIFYIIYFLRIPSDQQSYFKKRPLMFLAVVAYIIELLYLLWGKLDMLRIPVLIYALVIGTMLTLALWQYRRINNHTSHLFIAGAALFVLSDSALAINRFYQPHPWAGVFVMLTYVTAQTLIVSGSISHLDRHSNAKTDS